MKKIYISLINLIITNKPCGNIELSLITKPLIFVMSKIVIILENDLYPETYLICLTVFIYLFIYIHTWFPGSKDAGNDRLEVFSRSHIS
jgi:hypothetical protein